VELNDGTTLDEVVCEYPIGHQRRRTDGIPLLEAKFRTNLARRFPQKQQEAIFALCNDAKTLLDTPVNAFTDLWVI
ncbi:MAG: 2-methylcitrate dehydratase, partial [Microvirgula sp.]